MHVYESHTRDYTRLQLGARLCAERQSQGLTLLEMATRCGISASKLSQIENHLQVARFGGSVPASYNNFAGIGATDTNPMPAIFPDARTGVRAQIQHLRASPTRRRQLARCRRCATRASTRFHLVVPKGRTPMWNQMGNGNWATACTYASSILRL